MVCTTSDCPYFYKSPKQKGRENNTKTASAESWDPSVSHFCSIFKSCKDLSMHTITAKLRKYYKASNQISNAI